LLTDQDVTIQQPFYPKYPESSCKRQEFLLCWNFKYFATDTLFHVETLHKHDLAANRMLHGILWNKILVTEVWDAPNESATHTL